MTLTMLLSGCAQVNSSAKPDLFGYSDKAQKEAADSLSSGQCSPLDQFMIDYMKVRDQIRAMP